MEIEKEKRIIIRLSVIGLTLSILIGGVLIYSIATIRSNYEQHHDKYQAVMVGMDKSRVEEVLGQGLPENELPPWAPVDIDADAICRYPIDLLLPESVAYVLIWYKQNMVVGKRAYDSDGELLFDEKEVREMSSPWLYIKFLICIAISAFLSFFCIYTLRRALFLREPFRVLVYFSLLGELGIIIYLGFLSFLSVVSNLLLKI